MKYTEQAVETLDDAGGVIANKNIEIEQLRQHVQELERFHELDTKQIAYLFEERSNLTAERDKAHQYWQIAEGRCDSLVKQRDELLNSLEELSLYVAYNGDDWVQKKAKAAIASVKEKKSMRDIP